MRPRLFSVIDRLLRDRGRAGTSAFPRKDCNEDGNEGAFNKCTDVQQYWL